MSLVGVSVRASRVDPSLAFMTSGAGTKAKHLRRPIVVTVTVVFVTFVPRATYTTMLAIPSAFHNGRYRHNPPVSAFTREVRVVGLNRVTG